MTDDDDRQTARLPQLLGSARRRDRGADPARRGAARCCAPAGTPHATRPGRVLGMVFEKASTRTRASFEIAMFELGGHALYLGMQGSQLERGEPLATRPACSPATATAIMVRTFGHDRAEEMARYASVPVINGLTDLLHPCQVLADLQTVVQRFGARRRRPRRCAPRSTPGSATATTWPTRGSRRPAFWAWIWRWPVRPGYEPGRRRAGARARDRARAHHHHPRSGRGGRGAPGDLDRRVRLDGPGGGGRGAPAGVRRLLHRRRADAGRGAPTRSCCTACPPTAARRSPTR